MDKTTADNIGKWMLNFSKAVGKELGVEFGWGPDYRVFTSKKPAPEPTMIGNMKIQLREMGLPESTIEHLFHPMPEPKEMRGIFDFIKDKTKGPGCKLGLECPVAKCECKCFENDEFHGVDVKAVKEHLSKMFKPIPDPVPLRALAEFEELIRDQTQEESARNLKAHIEKDIAWQKGFKSGQKTATEAKFKSKSDRSYHSPSTIDENRMNVDPVPLRAQVAKLIGREVKFYNGKWYERDIDLRGPSIEIDRSGYRPIPKDDIEWAMQALEEYCRDKPIIGEIICFSDYWKVVIKHPSVGMGTDAINKSPSEAICLAIVKHAGAK